VEVTADYNESKNSKNKMQGEHGDSGRSGYGHAVVSETKKHQIYPSAYFPPQSQNPYVPC
jgi:hypothetical protein